MGSGAAPLPTATGEQHGKAGTFDAVRGPSSAPAPQDERPPSLMLGRLQRTVEEIAPLQTKLILLVGPPKCGKTALLRALAERT